MFLPFGSLGVHALVGLGVLPEISIRSMRLRGLEE
jgi:hypothetical protein